MRVRVPILGLFLLIPALSACGDSTSAPVPSRIVVTPGNATLDALGLSQQFSAQVEDKKGKVISDAVITWTSSNAEVASVNSSGLVTAVKKGNATIEATSEGLTGRATLVVDPRPAQVTKNAGDEQTGALSQPLAQQLEVEVRDSEGNPVVGVSVSFTVTAGEGSISPSLASTDAQGRAFATWTLGCSNEDPQRATATSGGISVEFTASADLALPAICQGAIPEGRVTFPYSVQLEVVGGDQATMTWSLESGSLPAGVDLSSSGFVAGIPEAPGTFTFMAKASDANGASASREYGLRVCEAPLTLAPGQTVALDPSGSEGCGFFLPTGSSGDRYRIGLLWTTSNPADTINLPTVTATFSKRLQAGVAPEPVRTAQFTPAVEAQDWLEGLPANLREAVEVDAATEAFHSRLREAEMTMIREMGPDARPLPYVRPALRTAGLQSPAPDKISLYSNSQTQCTPQSSRVTALKVAENDLVAIYQDSAQAQVDTAKVTTALAEMMLDYYESYGQTVIDDYFGGVSDINDDGRIVVLATPVVDEGVAAYVWSGDFFPTSQCANSNEMELVRFNAYVIRGMLDGNYQALATLVHEVKHVSSLYKSLARFDFYPSDYYQPTWVEEGTAEIAGEISSRLAWEATGGPAVNDMVVDQHKRSTGGILATKENYGVLLRFVRTIFYLNSQPNGVVGTPVGAPEHHSVYGSGWHFHRWLGDTFGHAAMAPMADASLFRTLNDSTSAVSPQAIKEDTGLLWPALLEEYASAIMLNGTGAPQPEWGFTSYNFVEATSGLLQNQPPGFYPWPVNVSGDNTTQTFSSYVNSGAIGPSGIRVYDFTSDGSGLGMEVKVVTTKGPIRIVVVRID